VTAIFITATGTDVGKTFVAAALIRHLRQMGHAVEAIKPIVSGFDPARIVSSDPGVLLAALGRPVSAEEIDRISPWRFRAALSPDLSAKREGRSIDVDAVIEFCQRTVAQQRGIVLIEGVGGIMVPLDDNRTVLDWMMALRIPLILVTGSYLGTISHTLTALDSLFRRELDVLAIIVSETPGSTVPLDETVKSIERFVHPLGVIGLPRARGKGDSDAGIGRIFAQRSRGPEPRVPRPSPPVDPDRNAR
jgi:dethiobiotin synthetase